MESSSKCYSSGTGAQGTPHDTASCEEAALGNGRIQQSPRPEAGHNL